MEPERYWLFNSLEKGLPGKLSVSEDHVRVFQGRRSLTVVFDPVQRRALAASGLRGTHEELEGGKESMSWAKSETPDFDVLDGIANSLLRDLEALLVSNPAAAESGGELCRGGKRRKVVTLPELNQGSAKDCVSLLSLFRYPAAAQSLLHEDRGLLTLVYCPKDQRLRDRDGKPVTTSENQIVVLAGAALALASGGRFPVTLHSIASAAAAAQQPLERVSLVFRCRGSARAVVEPTRFKPDSRESALPLEDFYGRFEAEHSSVNRPVSRPAAGVGAATAAAAVQKAAAATAPAPVVPLPESSTVKFSIVDQSTGDRLHFEVKRVMRFGKVFEAYAARSDKPVDANRLYFDGMYLHSEDTPKLIELEDDDEIYVTPVSTGD